MGTTQRNTPRRRRAILAALRVACGAAFVLLAVAAPATSGGLGAQSRRVLDQVLTSRTLPNGLEVIVVENHAVPLVTLEVDVRNGAFTQTAATAGLAHLYEHMFFKANARWPDAEEFLARASELGARFNATTGEERVNYFLTLPRDSIVGGLDFLAAALTSPLFLADELAREREVVLGEYDRRESDPFFAAEQALGALQYGAQWPRKNTIGDRAVIGSATPEQMREIQRRFYVPNNAALIVTGDVEPAAVFALAERVLGSWPRRPDPFAGVTRPPLPPIARDTAIITEAPVSAVTVLLRWNGPSARRDRAATYAADVFSDALNAPGSRLQQRLVDSGLWLGVLVNYYTLDDTGPITISGQTTADRFPQAMRALERELAQLGDSTYVRPEELRHAQASRTVSSAFGLERASDLAHTIGFWWSVVNLDYFLGYVDEMARQTRGDLARYAATWIVGKPRIAAVLLSPEDRRTLSLTPRDLLPAAARGGK